MRDKWYSDNRDLVKWGVLLRLADQYGAQRILQVAFYRPSTFGKLMINGKEQDLPKEVIHHFRNLQAVTRISPTVRVTVFDVTFEDRTAYMEGVLSLLSSFGQERCIVFLDPDTGLEPHKKPTLNHVLEAEARAIWEKMKTNDIFVLYQHQTNRSGKKWIGTKQVQLARALGVKEQTILVAEAPEIARDVAFFVLVET